jgi:glycosyltransferase involved in cell wall biosynthesis
MGLLLYTIVYFLVMLMLPVKKHKDHHINTDKTDYDFKFTISIIIPSYNEGKLLINKIYSVISSLIEFKKNYPHSYYNLIIVDESTDDTQILLQDIFKNNDQIILLFSSERLGYTKAITKALEQIDSEFVLITDAHSFFDRSTIINLFAKLMSNSDLGLVSGVSKHVSDYSKIQIYDDSKISFENSNLISSKERFYQKLFNKVRATEELLGNTFWIRGEACLFYKELYSKSKEYGFRGSFDSEIGFKTRLLDKKVSTSFSSFFYEIPVTSNLGFKKQKTTRASHVIRTLMNNKSIPFKKLKQRKPQFFGFVNFITYFLFLFIIPLTLPIFVIIISLLVLSINAIYFFYGTIFIILTTIIISFFSFGRTMTILCLSMVHASYKEAFRLFKPNLFEDGNFVEIINETRTNE